MKYVRNFKNLPSSLMGLFFVYLSVPIFSLFLLETPWTLLQTDQYGKAILLFCVYWAIPLGLCYSLLDKHHWFFPLYVFLCIGLTLHTIFASSSQPMEVQFARFLLIGLMIYIGFLFGNKNFLYPLITKKIRFWRKSIRYQIGRNIFVIGNTQAQTIPGLLMDCSKSGVRISVHRDDLDELLKHCKKGDKIRVMIPANAQFAQEYILPMEVVWATNTDNQSRQFGCRTLDKHLMSSYMASEKLGSAVPLHFPTYKNLNLEQDIQETALVLWLVCIALSFALPALGG